MGKKAAVLTSLLMAAALSSATAEDGGQDQDAPRQPASGKELAEWAAKKFGSPEKAAADACLQGWRYFAKGDMDSAKTRFEQALAVDAASAEANWGMGAVLARQRKRVESMQFLEKAASLAPQNPNISLDLAVQYAGRAKAAADSRSGAVAAAEDFKKAEDIFSKISGPLGGNPNFHLQHAISLYYQERMQEAWDEVSKAEAMGGAPSTAFLKALSAKSPRPKPKQEK